MPDGRAANQPSVETTLSPPIGAPLPGAVVRIDVIGSPARVDAVTATTLAGDPIVARLTRAPGNDAPIGGLKVVSTEGWFAARPSGTENVTKLYAESFRGEAHLERILAEAGEVIAAAVRG